LMRRRPLASSAACTRRSRKIPRSRIVMACRPSSTHRRKGALRFERSGFIAEAMTLAALWSSWRNCSGPKERCSTRWRVAAFRCESVMKKPSALCSQAPFWATNAAVAKAAAPVRYEPSEPGN
jgi:hypothetical protein